MMAKSNLYEVNGHKLYVLNRGPSKGPVVILLHHGLGSVRAWRKQIPALASAGYRTIAIDRWGYGRSDPRPALSPPTFIDDQQDLLSLMDQLGISQAELVGHSDGGTLALYFAIAYPERVSCLVTVSAHIYLDQIMVSGIQGVHQLFEGDGDFLRKFCRAHGDKYETVFKNWYNGWFKVDFQNWDMRPLLSQITCPLLVTQGSKDEQGTPEQARDIAKAIKGAELWFNLDAMHMMPVEKPDEFNHRLLEFLAQHLQRELIYS